MPSKYILPKPVKRYLLVFGFFCGFPIGVLMAWLSMFFFLAFLVVALTVFLPLLYLFYLSRKYAKLLVKWLPEEDTGFFDFLRREKD